MAFRVDPSESRNAEQVLHDGVRDGDRTTFAMIGVTEAGQSDFEKSTKSTVASFGNEEGNLRGEQL